MDAAQVWIIFFLPLASFAAIAALRAFAPRANPKLAGYITLGAIGGAFLLSLWALLVVWGNEGHEPIAGSTEWLRVGQISITMGLRVDTLTAVMLIVVTSVSFLVQFYSQGYMEGDPGYPRYFAFMSLFTCAMLGLVLADNLILLYVTWELVGLCSYLLIGFWFQRPAAAAAAKKAFVVTRLGDLGLLVAILLISRYAGTFTISELFSDEAVEALTRTGLLGLNLLTWVALGVFSGAVGKSAQFPLHVWLPDAMEGPTPVSALIHAATMVAAGVYLVARMFPLFHHSDQAMLAVAVVGGVTAIFAASMGLVMYDIKRVLAYSTISQLGYMMLALGAGGYVAGVFHLMNHAFFKALLFLGSGSVNHATGTFDMRLMGGLRRFMPVTYWTFVIASLSLAGVFPLSGFWSKDEVLLGASHYNQLLYLLALTAAFMTAFYMFRAIFMTFHGEYAGGDPSALHGSEHEGQSGHASQPHESPWVMTLPLLVLVVPSILSGLVNLGGGFGDFLLARGPVHEAVGEHEAGVNLGVAALSTLVALSGIGVAYLMYVARRPSAEQVGRAFGPLHGIISRKYYFDDLYEDFIVRRVVVGSLSRALSTFDTYVVDGLVNTVGWLGRSVGQLIKRYQTGQVQAYGLAVFAGLLLMVAGFELPLWSLVVFLAVALVGGFYLALATTEESGP